MPNPSCPTGYRWDTSSNKCVPITGTVDPIKPSTNKSSKKNNQNK